MKETTPLKNTTPTPMGAKKKTSTTPVKKTTGNKKEEQKPVASTPTTPSKKKKKPQITPATKTLLFFAEIFTLLMFLWIASAIFLRTIEVSYSTKAQKVSREIVEIEKEISGLKRSISELLLAPRLQDIAEANGMEYIPDRIEVIVKEQ